MVRLDDANLSVGEQKRRIITQGRDIVAVGVFINVVVDLVQKGCVRNCHWRAKRHRGVREMMLCNKRVRCVELGEPHMGAGEVLPLDE